jgi:hypothetical protein
MLSNMATVRLICLLQITGSICTWQFLEFMHVVLH